MSSAYSMPWPNVPDAVTTGFLSHRPRAASTDRSTPCSGSVSGGACGRPDVGDHRAGERLAQLVGDLRWHALGVNVTGRGLRDGRTIEIRQLNEILFLLALRRDLEGFFQ